MPHTVVYLDSAIPVPQFLVMVHGPPVYLDLRLPNGHPQAASLGDHFLGHLQVLWSKGAYG